MKNAVAFALLGIGFFAGVLYLFQAEFATGVPPMMKPRSSAPWLFPASPRLLSWARRTATVEIR